MLKKGGTLIVSTPNPQSLQHIARNLLPSPFAKLQAIEKQPGNVGDHTDHIYQFDLYTLYRLLHRKGFKYQRHHICEAKLPTGPLPFSLGRFNETVLIQVKKEREVK
jgi:hypothetical protein